MKGGGQTLWNAIAICEMSKTSWRMEKRHNERRFGEPFKGPIIPFGAMVEYHPISPKDQARTSSIGKKVSTRNLSWAVSWSREWNLERRYFDGRPGRFGIKYLSSELDDQTKRRFHIPRIADGNSTRSEYLTTIPRTHPKAGNGREEWWSQWIFKANRRLSTGSQQMTSSPWRLLVDPWWLHLSSSQWTSSSTLRAEGRS